MGKPWNRCDDCGRFIAIDDFRNGAASRYEVTPDSETTHEEYATLCKRCVPSIERAAPTEETKEME